ncbi:MAG: GNAT family N-acetyltransferase [Gammaproteobacteria bacterium]|nr:GNAT family N-acetyltransferase [Gammaproteobacteria bacterium]NND38572.1 GNAT family N-acetyltransferase [Pseudomonadales bacterium]MBT8150325.1 GNAT family N-acetyltransferase [Gammaproteobacteria bacterium]NNL11129.1 GNAT family N-acetyltransferase [Pseudomonadales bacterium]NNM10462.1 GNAT family N-acetyltransferase [Pseudomonadales bacterium]
MQWACKSFDELGNDELYALIKHRIDIFVVEQCCAYAELDNKDSDPNTRHILASRNGTLLAYARLLPPGLSYRDSSMGRFAVHRDARGQGLGSQLLDKSVAQAGELWPESAITISAQAHLMQFYQRAGFEPVSSEYMEDGIAHIEMHRAANAA